MFTSQFCPYHKKASIFFFYNIFRFKWFSKEGYGKYKKLFEGKRE